MNTHRAYRGTDTDITGWVRDEAGKTALTDLSVDLYAYGLDYPLSTLDATSPTEGQFSFTVTEDFALRYLAPGPYRFTVKVGDAAVYSGLLEVV